MLEPKNIRFQRLSLSDLPLMHRWLNTGEALRWYAKRPYSYQDVVEEYAPYINGEQPTSPFLIMYGDIPIGYIQTYKINDYPDYARYVLIDENVAGLDLFIGEPDYTHKGLGVGIISTFLREIVFGVGDAVSCALGPEPKNVGAIRVYEKIGFRYVRTIQVLDEDEPEYIMRVTREEFAALDTHTVHND